MTPKSPISGGDAASATVDTPSTGSVLAPSQSEVRARRGTTADLDLHAPVWKAFRYETGHFLLHVPSSHVLQVPATLAAHVEGDPLLPAAEHEAAAAHLAAVARDLPLPPPRRIETDIRAVSLNMAQGCNLRCTYCFAGEGDYGVKGLMRLATAVAALRFFAAGRSQFHVIFFGGEPMLNYAVIQETVAWCETQTCRFSFAMTTNGTLLTDEKLQWLRDKKVGITISYDGKGLHARQRLNKDLTSNSEAAVERKLAAFGDRLAELRSMTLRATVTKANLPLLEDAIMATLTSQNYRLAVSHHATPALALAFGPADVDDLGNVYRRVIDRLVAAGDYERLLKLDNVKKHVQTIHRGRTGLIACGAGVNYLTVSVEGAFYLCHRFNEDESENFGDLARGLDQAKLADIARFRGAKSAPCNSCWMREWCAGGCFHEHKAVNGDKFTLDPMYCKLQGLEIEQALRVYTILLERAPQLLEA